MIDPGHGPGGCQAAVSRRLAVVRERLARVEAGPGRVAIVAVTKGFGPQVAEAVVAAGLTDLGENYAGELLRKHDVMESARSPAPAGGPPPARWHFLGAVQRNKVAALAPLVQLWHGLTRLVEGEEIARWSPGTGVLVQVASVPGSRGVDPDAAQGLVAGLVDLGLDVRGLMTLGQAGAPEGSRRGFRRLAELGGDLGLAELSMGMSDDLEVAVQEGATIIRLGRALLGPRPDPVKLREWSLAGGG